MKADMNMMVCLLCLDTVSWVHMVMEHMDLHTVVEVETVLELEFKRVFYYAWYEAK
jgi:hypothetical protein